MVKFLYFLQDNFSLLIPWLITILAMLLSFYSSVKSNSIARLAINKTILSRNREEWIRNFKEDIANLLVLLALEQTESNLTDIKQGFKDIMYLTNKIILSLNHKDPISITLLNSLLSLKNSGDIKNISQLTTKIMKSSIDLIEQEGAKIDNLD